MKNAEKSAMFLFDVHSCCLWQVNIVEGDLRIHSSAAKRPVSARRSSRVRTQFNKPDDWIFASPFQGRHVAVAALERAARSGCMTGHPNFDGLLTKRAKHVNWGHHDRETYRTLTASAATLARR